METPCHGHEGLGEMATDTARRNSTEHEVDGLGGRGHHVPRNFLRGGRCHASGEEEGSRCRAPSCGYLTLTLLFTQETEFCTCSKR